MKIFNTLDGKKSVYVQKSDIVMLRYTDIPVPVSVFEKVCDGNEEDFVEFTDSEGIDFFKTLDWIVDYKQIRNLSEYEIKEKEREITNEINEIVNKFSFVTDKEQSDNQLLRQRYRLLEYKNKCFSEAVLVKNGYKQLSFPVVPDSDGFSFIGDNNCKYEISASFDQNKILLFRKDRKKLSNNDRIPQGFLQMGMSIAVMKRNENNLFFGDYEMSNYFTEDNQYFVTEFKNRSYDNAFVKEEKEDKGIKKLVKRILNKNRK